MGLQQRFEELPSASELVDPAVEVTLTAFEVLVGIFFVLAFAAYWILVGAFAGVVESVPVIGPLAAGTLAVGVGLTESWQLAAAAGIAVLAVRLLEDYLVIPRVLGEAVGLSPLVVLFAVTGTAVLFGEFAVLLAIPIAAVVATLVDVIVLTRIRRGRTCRR